LSPMWRGSLVKRWAYGEVSGRSCRGHQCRETAPTGIPSSRVSVGCTPGERTTAPCGRKENGGACHTSMALDFYGASKKSLHKLKATFGNVLCKINYGFNYYLQLLCLQFPSKTHLNFKNSLLASK
jgi:hypothetical protein